MGFAPAMIVGMHAVSLIYQFWIHTEAIGKLPRWFEFIFNTPSHHRVHHGSNPQYLDRNYGGILIIWDRMFGIVRARGRARQVRPDQEHPHLQSVQGLRPRVDRDLARRARRDNWRDRFGYAFRGPGWTPGSEVDKRELEREHPEDRGKRAA